MTGGRSAATLLAMLEHWDGVENLLLVESYGPQDGVAPVRAGGEMDGVRVHAVIAVPADEVVFYIVSGPSEPVVRRRFAELGVVSVRIVPARWALEP